MLSEIVAPGLRAVWRAITPGMTPRPISTAGVRLDRNLSPVAVRVWARDGRGPGVLDARGVSVEQVGFLFGGAGAGAGGEAGGGAVVLDLLAVMGQVAERIIRCGGGSSSSGPASSVSSDSTHSQASGSGRSGSGGGASGVGPGRRGLGGGVEVGDEVDDDGAGGWVLRGGAVLFGA